MPRLPVPGADANTWGQILNDYLSAAHNTDGTLKENVVTANAIAPGAITVAEIHDQTISEDKLDPLVQSKLNTGGGTPGATGSQGPVGAAGATGATGPAGATTIAGISGLQAALDAKAESSALATVATSGDYTDLTNTPSLPTITVSSTAPSSPVTGDVWIDIGS